MMHLRLIRAFISASAQEEAAYRANFYISLLHSLLNFATGLLGLGIIYGQVQTIQGWDYASALAVLGVYLTVSALRGLMMGPSLDALAGMDGEVWRGAFDFTLLRPVRTQFLVSVRKWRLFALFDLLLGLLVLGTAVTRLNHTLSLYHIAAFLLALAAGLLALYAILLAAASLVFWDPGLMVGWVFDSVFQMARYPVGLYPGWLRLVLTWIIPVGFITSIPAAALSEGLSWELLGVSLAFALVLAAGASWLFRAGLRRYASASS
ncbi:MAG: ABC-2 family transporter protein [Chloroflexi bacterium]|nr:ABC-2 family transporter protein [Chloroflexota bacterium]MBK7917742.1 ABC-2 family transporter protein [Chloroflexota bacterium]MBP6803564.1 ABC-2 family transporter protein [Chloroflexota bacterium]